MFFCYIRWPESSPQYDGVHCFPDVWETVDGTNWTLLTANASFGPRAWMASGILTNPTDIRRDFPLTGYNYSAKMYLFGGGNLGFYTSSSKQILKMDGRLDAWSSRDGVKWTRINYQEGGGKTVVQLFSSQEWTKSIVDTKTIYLGMWGQGLVAFNTTDGYSPPDRFLLIGGKFS